MYSKIRQLRRFIEDVPYNLKKVKWFYQRGRWGWADCDWWNIHAYLINIILPMLRELKEKKHGCPGVGQAKTSEQWDAILDRMILGFEAGKRVINDEYFMETNADILIRKPTKDEVKGWVEKSTRDQKIFREGMKLFAKWYFALWD